MKCKVDKAGIQKAIKVIKKLLGNESYILLKIDEDEEILSLIVDSNRYIKYNVPVTKAVSGKAVLSFPLLESILSKLKDSHISIEKKKNVVEFKGGAEFNLFCANIQIKDNLSFSKKKASVFEISSKNVGNFKEILNSVAFNIKFSELGNAERQSPCIIENTKKGLTVKLADAGHCAFYENKEPICDKSFKLATIKELFAPVFALMNTEVTLYISKSELLVTSPFIAVTIPTVQTGTHFIENGEEPVNNDSLYEKKITMNAQEFKDAVSSLGSVAELGSHVHFILKNGKIMASLKSNSGNSKVTLDCETSLKRAAMKLPIPYLSTLVKVCSVGEKVTFQLEKNKKFYRMKTTTSDLKVIGVGPTLS